MNQNRKGNPSQIALYLKTNNFTGGETEVLSIKNSTINLEHIASIIPRVFRDRQTARRFDWKRQKPGRIKAL